MPPYVDPTRQNQINRTKTGLLLLLIGTLISWIPIVGLLGGLLVLIGAILVILGRKAFGSAHSRNVIIALLLVFVSIIGAAALVAILIVSLGTIPPGSDPQTIANAVKGAFNSFVIGLVIVAAIGGISSVLFTYALQKQMGKMLLWAGYVANLAVTIAIAVVVSGAVAAAADTIIGGGTYDAAALTAQATSYGLLSVIPSILFAAATYLAWQRVSRGEIPAPIGAPAMPAAGTGAWPPTRP